MSLLSLPTEVLIKVLLQLDIPTAYSCQRVNQWFRSLYQTSIELQYALECEIAGVEDNPFCQLPVPLRLEMLRARESAWSSLNPIFTKVQSLPTPFTSIASFDVVDGHIFLGFGGFENRTPHLKAGVRSHPVPLKGDEKDVWTSYDFEGLIAFAVAVDENDLLAALIKKQKPPTFTELSVSLVSHSHGSPHPLAHQPIFTVARFEPALDALLSRMEVVGENLVVFLATTSDCTLYFFNWKTGQLKSPPIQGLEYTDIAFLSHDVMLYCPGQDHNVFDVLYIPPSSEGGEVKLIQTLRLPAPFPYYYDRTFVRATPNPRESPSFPKYISPQRAFVDRPEEAIMLFTFHREALPDVTFRPIALVIHRKSLIDLLPPRLDWTYKDPPVLEWDQWGPGISRSFECCTQTICYGQRFIYVEPLVEEPPLVIFDFNVYRNRQRVIRQDDQLLPEPASSVEDSMIEGRLSFTSYRSSSLYGFGEMHLSDTGVVCFHIESPEVPAPLNFTVLHFG